MLAFYRLFTFYPVLLSIINIYELVANIILMHLQLQACHSEFRELWLFETEKFPIKLRSSLIIYYYWQYFSEENLL